MPTISKLRSCSQWKELKSIHATMIKNSDHQKPLPVNQLIAACSAFRRMDYANLVFRCMEAPNTFVYNAIIRACVLCKSPVLGVGYYLQMVRSQVPPTTYTFSSLIKACSQVTDEQLGKAVHGRIWKSGFDSQVFVGTALIDYYSEQCMCLDAQKVFDDMTERDIIAWTCMLSCYTRSGNLCDARRMFEKMPERSTVSWNTLIVAYARSGDFESASALFEQMPSKDVVSWTSMISAYSQHENYKEAIDAFRKMKTKGVTPDEVTLATVISACAHLGALDLGKELHLCLTQYGFDLDVYTGSALIDMYAKCGCMERSLVIFIKLKEKNLFCWNSVIEGLAIHGNALDALSMFCRMERNGVKPNKVTFVSVLSACSHAGLVDEGHRIFLSMTSDHSIPPELEHYGCMVDLLCRAGHLNDALSLIGSMTLEPNSVIWGALLGGCKTHRNLDIGKVAVDKLMALEPSNSGYYLLLINLYAETNHWTDVALTRGAMKGRGVEKKIPGHSWIELEGIVYEFVACDPSHPKCDEVCTLLVELDVQLKRASYSLNLEGP